MIKQITITTDEFTLEVRGATLGETLEKLEKMLPYVENLDGAIKLEDVEPISTTQTQC